MADLTGLSCFFNASAPNDVFVCLGTSGGVNAWSIIFIGLLLLFCVAFSLFTSVGKGIMIGGFFMTLAGLALFALGLITVKLWFLALILTIAGLVISVVESSSND